MSEEKIDARRRRFLVQLMKSAGLAAVGGIAWSGVVHEVASSPLVLRPPGALDTDEFLAHCIKCGLCVQACPYDTLKLAAPGDDKPLGTPFFIPRDVPCYMCQDIPCVPVCPSGALDEASVSVERDGKPVLDINKAKIGIAVVDNKSCLAYWGIQCDACYRVCPLIDRAITLDYDRNRRTGMHATLIPYIDPDHCTGCGLCEHACITDKASITVLPLDVVQGSVDARYIKGWDSADESRIDPNRSQIRNETERSNRDPVDYLNEDILSDE